MHSDNYYDYWHELAIHDKVAAEILTKENSYPDIIIYHLHQAVEKLLKGLIVKNNSKLLYIHDLERLYKMVASLDPRYLDSSLESAIIGLHSYYSDLRYPQSDLLSKDDLLDAKSAFKIIWDKLI